MEQTEWSNLDPADFAPATASEKASFQPERESVPYWKDAWRRLRRNGVAMAALVVLVFLTLFAVVGPLIVPYDYSAFQAGAENLRPWHYSLEDQRKLAAAALTLEEALEKARAESEAAGRPFTAVDEARIRAEYRTGANTPDPESLGIRKKLFGYSVEELERMEQGEWVFPHVLGTDNNGRDILARVMVGTRVSLAIGVSAALLVLVIGAVYGAVSGYFGGRVDTVMQRIVEIIYAMPVLLVVLLLATALKPTLEEFVNGGTGPLRRLVLLLGPNLISLFAAFALLYWVTMSRIVRGQVLQLKQQEYVTAAKALGASGGRIIRRHLLPNCVGQIVVTTCLQIPSAIFLESFLSFLGVGVAAPMTSLGSMASDALGGMYSYPERLVIPAAVLALLILSFNLFGDGLRDALDPKLKR